ncbi:MAG: alginate export family protein [Cyclobacteriaceae bacterium]
MKKLLLISAFAISSLSVLAQFSITGEIRPRSEFRNGFKKLNSDATAPAFFTEQRSRIYMDYKSDQYVVRISLQDIRIWGDTPQIFKADNGMTAISEAWGLVRFTPKVGLKIGRQIISYDNQRYLGGLEWAQQGRRHDAVVLQLEDGDKKLKFHLGAAYNQSGTIPEPKKVFGNDYLDVANYKAMQYAWFHKDFEGGGLSVLAFNESKQYATTADSISMRQTLGAVASKAVAGIKLAGEGYYQTGKVGLTDVSAFMFDFNATFKTSITPITVGYQYLSGSESGATEINHFTPAYGTNHMHNGFMDYFYVGNPHGNAGLQDIYVKTKFKAGEKGVLIGHAHQFMSASTVLDGEGASMSSSFGTEVDLVYALKLNPATTINVGYSHLIGTETLQAVKGGDHQSLNNWAWVMITVKPKFFESTN